MNVLKKILLVLILIFTVGLQIASSQGLDLGIAVNGGFPQGAFKDNVEQNGFGLDGILGYQIPRSPFTIGINLGFITYGQDSRTENFSPNIPEVQIRVKTNNNIFTGHLFSRIEAKQGRVRPYADGLIGLNYLFTESKITDDDNFNGEAIVSTTNFDDSAFSYGAGGGVKFKIADHIDAEGDRSRWFIDLKIRYMFGGQAEYLREGSIRNVNGNLLFDSDFSHTDLLTVGVGFIVNLN